MKCTSKGSCAETFPYPYGHFSTFCYLSCTTVVNDQLLTPQNQGIGVQTRDMQQPGHRTWAENQRRRQENSNGGPSFHLGGRPCPLPPLPLPSLPFPFSSPSLPSPPFLLLLSLPFPLRSRPPKIQLGGLGSAVSSPSEVWVGAPADKRFGAF